MNTERSDGFNSNRGLIQKEGGAAAPRGIEM